MRVVITGAAGRIGIQMVEELSESHELRLLDRVPVPGRKSLVADLAETAVLRGPLWGFRRESWIDSFEESMLCSIWREMFAMIRRGSLLSG